MHTLQPWVLMCPSAFGQGKGRFIVITIWVHTANSDVHASALFCLTVTALLPRTCSPSLKIEHTSTWSHPSKPSTTVQRRRSWNHFLRKSTEGKGRRVSPDSCGQQDSCSRQSGYLSAALSFRTFRYLKKRLMKPTRLEFPMTCVVSFSSNGWYF